MTIAERAEAVRQTKLCYICLKRNHIAANCEANLTCGINGCQGRHSRWLHRPGDIITGGWKEDGDVKGRYKVETRDRANARDKRDHAGGGRGNRSRDPRYASVETALVDYSSSRSRYRDQDMQGERCSEEFL